MGTKGPGPLKRQGDLVGQGLHHKHVGLVEAPYLATLHVEHANQALTKADRYGQFTAGVGIVFDIMNVVAYIVDQQRLPCARHMRNNPRARPCHQITHEFGGVVVGGGGAELQGAVVGHGNTMHRVIAEMLTNQAQHLGQQFVWLKEHRQMRTDVLDGLELHSPFARFVEGAGFGDGHRRLVGNLRQPA